MAHPVQGDYSWFCLNCEQWQVDALHPEYLWFSVPFSHHSCNTFSVQFFVVRYYDQILWSQSSPPNSLSRNIGITPEAWHELETNWQKVEAQVGHTPIRTTAEPKFLTWLNDDFFPVLVTSNPHKSQTYDIRSLSLWVTPIPKLSTIPTDRQHSHTHTHHTLLRLPMSVLLIWTKLLLHSSVVSTLKLAALMYTKLGSDSLSISAFWVGPFLLAANRIGYWSYVWPS